jgi:hypothetical protein
MPPLYENLTRLAALRETLLNDLQGFISDGHWELGVAPQENLALFVANNCRPALVLPYSAANPPRDTHAVTLPENGDPAEVLLTLDAQELLQAHEELLPIGGLFQCVPQLEALRGKTLTLAMKYDLYGAASAWAEGAERTAKHSGPSLLETLFVPTLTLPEFDLVFPRFDYRNTWEALRAEQYEKWCEWELDRLLGGRRGNLVQIGGWPQYVQGGDATGFIAQVNNDVGDCGSVYLSVNKKGELLGDIQMA